jgi:cytidylate kinase
LEHSIGALLDRQSRRWQIDQGAGMPRSRGPVVACSRWSGALGEEVAARVAEWLDYGLFGPEALDRLAADAEQRRRLAAGLDEAARRAVDAQIETVMTRMPAAPRALVESVATLGARGMAVLLGRGAAAILPSSRALRVLVVAPPRLRAERLAEAQGVPIDEAVACIASADGARQAALRETFGIAAEDLTHYDLVINTEELSVEAGAALIVDALRRRFPARAGS